MQINSSVSTTIKKYLPLAPIMIGAIAGTVAFSDTSKEKQEIMTENKAKVAALLDTFNTGDTAPIAFISKQDYKQHNLDVGDGLEGFGAVMQNAPPQGFKSRLHRIFADGDTVIAHVEYDFFGPKAGFDVFRFKDGLIVEHWDNLTEITPPNPSGRSQFDGVTDVSDIDATEKNKAVAAGFVNNVLVGGQTDKLAQYVSTEQYLQHNSAVADGLDGLGAALQHFAENGLVMQYDTVHQVLGEGNFVLTMSEGKFGKGDHVAYYDLFRLEDGLIVEHWDVIQPIPPEADWKNQNGKF